MRDPATGTMVRAGDQKMVAATFRRDTPRNLDPQLHTHAVVANMVQGGDGKWRTMVDDGLFSGKMAIGAIYRAELAAGLRHIDRAFAATVHAFQGRTVDRILAAMPAENPKLVNQPRVPCGDFADAGRRPARRRRRLDARRPA